MQELYDVTQFILQLLGNPILGGIGSICSLVSIPLAIYLARQAKVHSPQQPNGSKKI